MQLARAVETWVSMRTKLTIGWFAAAGMTYAFSNRPLVMSCKCQQTEATHKACMQKLEPANLNASDHVAYKFATELVRHIVTLRHGRRLQ